MPIHVRMYCHFNNTGMGRHCESAYNALKRHESETVAVDYIDSSASSIQVKVQKEFDAPVTLFFRRHSPEIVRAFPGRRFLWWFFESDKLPETWLKQIEVFDKIWAPTPWARYILISHGISPSRIQSVGSAVDTRIFYPAPQPHAGYVFLSVGKYEKRKSIDEVIEAYLAEFPAADYPDVRLWLKADFPLYPDRVNQLAAGVSHDPRILIVSGNATDATMARLYCMADAFVFPSKAEGFGLPCLEAIACGLPVIATCLSGHESFLSRIPGLFASVDFDYCPIIDADYRHFYEADYAGTAFGNWGIPSISSLRNRMKEVYENASLWKERACEAAVIIRNEFSWDAIGRNALAALKEFDSKQMSR